MSESKILTTVNGAAITDADVDGYIRSMPQEQQQYASNPQFRAQVLNQLVSIRLLALKGADDGLDQTEDYKRMLEAAKLDILAQLEVNAILGGIQVTDEEAKADYEQNKAQYTRGEAVGAKHILVDSEEKCQQIMDSINAGEISFEDAAKIHSSCPSKEQGGDLGQFTRGQMVPEFDKAAFEAEEGSMVGPVKTQFGYHAIKVYSKTGAGAQPYEAVAEQVKRSLLGKKQQAAYGAVLEEYGRKYVK